MPNIKRIPADAPPAPDPMSEAQLRNAIVKVEKEANQLNAIRQQARQKREWDKWEKTTEPLQALNDELVELQKRYARLTAEEAGETSVKVGTAKESNK